MSNILIVAAHPDDEVLGCGGTILKKISEGYKVNVIFISCGVRGRFKKEFDQKIIKKEIIKRQKMAIKASKIAKFKIVDFFDLENLELHQYKHNFITDKISKVLKIIKPEIVFTHHAGDNNIDHKTTFESTFIASRPNKFYKVKEFLTFEIPSSTDWSNPNNSTFVPRKYVDISKFSIQKVKLLNCYKQELGQYPYPRSLKNIEALEIYRGGICGAKKAEAFDVIRLVD